MPGVRICKSNTKVFPDNSIVMQLRLVLEVLPVLRLGIETAKNERKKALEEE